jgi:glycosyltransferase involved in cell wall biosynthesis
LGQWLRRHAGEFDLIHAHAVFTYSTLAARWAAKTRNVPLVITPHGMLAPYSLGRKAARKLFYWHLVERRNLAATSFVHATAPAEQEEIAQLLPGHRIECVSLGVDPAETACPRTPGVFRRRFGIPDNAPLLLYLARIHSKKGLVDLVLPALARLPTHVRLAVVGEADAGEPEQAALARSTAERLGVAERVTFAGAAYGDQKWAAYDDADLYVLPSRHENFGVTVIEAMARGVPCVITPGVQCAPLVSRAGAGRIVPGAVAELASELERLLAAPSAERQAMGRRGQEFVARELSWEQTARRLAELYRSVVSAGKAPHAT